LRFLKVLPSISITAQAAADILGPSFLLKDEIANLSNGPLDPRFTRIAGEMVGSTALDDRLPDGPLQQIGVVAIWLDKKQRKFHSLKFGCSVPQTTLHQLGICSFHCRPGTPLLQESGSNEIDDVPTPQNRRS
jgi:hypothetical protein